MAFELFGFRIGRPDSTNRDDRVRSFAPPAQDDGALEIASGGSYGTYVDLEGTAKTEGELVTRYREMSLQPECEYAIDDICNEAIINSEKEPTTQIVLDRTKLPENIKATIREQFDVVVKLLDFENIAYEIFKKWYVDGRLYYHIMIDEKNPRGGIQELRYVDPRKIRKVREPRKQRKDRDTGADLDIGYQEYFLYSPRGLNNANQGIKVSPDSICHVTSGIMDQRAKLVLGYLHKAIKPLNQLRMLEDATVIYRLARAPERRIFYIDVGNLPKQKAEQYLRDMMVKHKNKLVYDASTGEVRDDRKFMTMLEDFWLPRREGGRGTEITTLPGGQNLGEMDDVEYFRRRLYKSLNVPVSRLETENQFNLGRSSEITRDEVKFSKLIQRLRSRFSHLFMDILETQLILKGITNRKDWKEIKANITFDYLEDNHFTELKEGELLENRMRLLGEVDQYVGKYFSAEYIRTNILRMSESDVIEIQKQIDREESETEFEGEEEPQEEEKKLVPSANVQPYIPPQEASAEEKNLVESMTRYDGDKDETK